MTITAEGEKPVAWWREPTREQWYAWWAAWLGWTLDAFDFTVFLLIMEPIAEEFHVPLAAVAFVLTITLWMRLIGAVAAGWLADRVGRKTPLMISIAWYSLANFIAGFSPTLWFLLLFRALLGIGMGAEWPVGAALVMENWPQRSRGLMSGILQSSGNLGFLLSSVHLWAALQLDRLARHALARHPARPVDHLHPLLRQRAAGLDREPAPAARHEGREVKDTAARLFRRAMIGNTLTACWFMASAFVTYYSINSLFASHHADRSGYEPRALATPIVFANLLAFVAATFWGWTSDRIGRRWAMILPGPDRDPAGADLSVPDNVVIVSRGVRAQGFAGTGGMNGQIPAYLNERFPTEVRATATGFCFHQGAIFGGLVPPILTYLAATWGTGLALPMLIGTVVGAGSFIIALLLGPETKGKEIVPDLVRA